MKATLEKLPNGQVTWIPQEGDRYLATGVDRDGRRFRIEHSNWRFIDAINVWQGNKWLLRGNKRYRIQSVFN